jgi:DNA-binding NarL/FixJ family response regulator
MRGPSPQALNGSMSLRVLLVDDDARFRAAACRTLVAEGIDVVAQVDNGTDVADASARWRPDVVLLDIGLPDIGGLEVARRLRGVQGGPVVILISTRDAAYGQRVANGLAAGYLPKDQLSLRAILEIGPSAS